MTPTKEYANEIFSLLKSHYPQAKMILEWHTPWELLVAIILSAQCTDKKVNEVTARLFPKYKNSQTSELEEIKNYATVPLQELEQDIKSTGFYHNKAKNIQKAAGVVLETYNGVLPKTITALTKIPGVGRKTANVFLTNAYHIDEGIAVDTHVTKQAQALKLTHNTKPEKIEQDLMQLFPKDKWHTLTYLLIEHGRNLRKKKSDRVTCGNPTCPLGI